MKSKHLLMALLSGGLTFGSCTSTPHVPEGKYLIAGMLKNVPDSTVISLYKSDGKLLKQIQTDTVINGKFSFQDTVSSPSPQQLMLLSDNEGFPAYGYTYGTVRQIYSNHRRRPSFTLVEGKQ